MTARRTGHLIADIHYAPHNGPSWLICATDNERLQAPTPDTLADAWVAHGGKAGADAGHRSISRQYAAGTIKRRPKAPDA